MRTIGQTINDCSPSCGCQHCSPDGDQGVAHADIDAPEAWSIWQGPPQGDFVIAVVDSGVDITHPELSANIWTNPGESGNGRETNGQDDDGNGCVDDVHGCNFLPVNQIPPQMPNGDISDNVPAPGHGTRVAGVIAAVTNNAFGVAGTMWRAKIVPLRICEPGIRDPVCYSSLGAKAIDYCVGKGIRLSNHSWGGTDFSQSLYTAIANARDAQPVGHIVVASAGNDNLNTDTYYHYPSGYALNNIISVAATDNDDNLAVYLAGASNWGPQTVDLAAPGKNIFSTGKGGGYAFGNGTSFAAPHVTGVAGLVWSRFDSWTWAQVKNRVIQTVRPLWSLQGKTLTGGMVNAYNAVGWNCGGNCTNAMCLGVHPDCNANGFFDGCDIAVGTSLDRDGDRVPDECGACCTEGEGGVYTCENLLQSACSDPSQFTQGVTCDDCNCLPSVPCCTEEGCCDIPACECVARGGARGPGISPTCMYTDCSATLGACCFTLHCEQYTKDWCGAGPWLGGMTCSDVFELCPVLLGCADGTIVPAQSAPLNGVVDARYPHVPNYPSQRRGIGGPVGAENDKIRIKLMNGQQPVTDARAANVACWCLCETSPDPVLGSNTITNVAHEGNGIYRVTLARPITPGQGTTISYADGTTFMSFFAHPANVNGDSTSAPVDILESIDFLNGVKLLPWELYSGDIDRSGVIAPADILAEIDLLNGANGFTPWNGVSRPASVAPCPVAAACAGQLGCPTQGAGAMGMFGSSTSSPTDGVAVAASDNAYFTDWFVNYVTVAAPISLTAEADCRLIVEALSTWCVDHFSAEERSALGKRLSAAASLAASPVGSELAAAAALRVEP